MKIESDDPRWKLDYYDSMSEVIAVIDKPITMLDNIKPASKADDANRSSRYGRGDNFYGATWAEAYEMAKYGWSSARPNLDAILTPVREKLSETLDYSQERGLDMTGFEPDIDLYLSGELECMVDYVPNEVRKVGKVFNLVVNVGPGGWSTASDIFTKGAAICALVESLQMLGYDLNIWAEDSSCPMVYGDYDHHTVLVRIHRAGDNLDINQVMFPLGHPAWMRRIMFAVREHSDEAIRRQFGYSTKDWNPIAQYDPMEEQQYSMNPSAAPERYHVCSACFEPLKYGSHPESFGWPSGSHWHPECCPQCNPKDRNVNGYGTIVRKLMCEEMVDASFVLSLQDRIGESTEDVAQWVLDQLVLQGVWSPDE